MSDLLGIFLVSFDNVVGSVLEVEIPKKILEPVRFEHIAELTVVKPDLCGRVIFTRVPRSDGGFMSILTYPVCLEHEKYQRNSLLFGVGFVLQSNADHDIYSSALRRLCHQLITMETEVELFFLPQKRIQLAPILTEVYKSLRNHGECFIPFDATNSIALRLQTSLSAYPNVEPWSVPVPIRNLDLLLSLSGGLGAGWDPCAVFLIPYIDGINHVQAISDISEVELPLVTRVVSMFLASGAVVLCDIFQYSNVYITTFPSPYDVEVMAQEPSKKPPGLLLPILDDDALDACAAFVTYGYEKHMSPQDMEVLSAASMLGNVSSLSLPNLQNTGTSEPTKSPPVRCLSCLSRIGHFNLYPQTTQYSAFTAFTATAPCTCWSRGLETPAREVYSDSQPVGLDITGPSSSLGADDAVFEDTSPNPGKVREPHHYQHGESSGPEHQHSHHQHSHHQVPPERTGSSARLSQAATSSANGVARSVARSVEGQFLPIRKDAVRAFFTEFVNGSTVAKALLAAGMYSGNQAYLHEAWDRRLIQWGVMHGVIRRVHWYPILAESGGGLVGGVSSGTAAAATAEKGVLANVSSAQALDIMGKNSQNPPRFHSASAKKQLGPHALRLLLNSANYTQRYYNSPESISDVSFRNETNFDVAPNGVPLSLESICCELSVSERDLLAAVEAHGQFRWILN